MWAWKRKLEDLLSASFGAGVDLEAGVNSGCRQNKDIAWMDKTSTNAGLWGLKECCDTRERERERQRKRETQRHTERERQPYQRERRSAKRRTKTRKGFTY
jgi:hypothetical protein